MSTQESSVSRGASGADKAHHRPDQCGRGSWWLETLKDTPLPGHYPIRDFLEESELNPVQRTYGFKGLGRRGRLGVNEKEMYCFPSLRIHRLHTRSTKTKRDILFQNCPRPENVTLGVRDKDLQISPCHYEVAAKPVEKIPCK
ncbi:hypothetical protein WMY93_018289 [Mugilogobius chulae]|uniref:Uncharacterized protein n=1 Tax=Mugilogobius chulae TaxID=88201 RepID=A0AAW0NIF5_9GOBI